MSTSDLRILVCCHKPAELVMGGVYTPIHCGRAVMQEVHKDGTLSMPERRWLLEHCIGDDTGDNISAKNRSYNELTAYYWAWKNYEKLGNPSYIGFTHYRRGFLPGASPKGGCIARFSTLSPELRALILDTERLDLGQYELYAPEHTQACRLKVVNGRYDWTQRPPVPCRVVEKNPGNIGLPQTLDYVQAHYPHRSEHLRRYLHTRRAFQWNMAIFQRDIFFDYANYLFDVLQHVEKQIDSSSSIRRIDASLPTWANTLPARSFSKCNTAYAPSFYPPSSCTKRSRARQPQKNSRPLSRTLPLQRGGFCVFCSSNVRSPGGAVAFTTQKKSPHLKGKCSSSNLTLLLSDS